MNHSNNDGDDYYYNNVDIEPDPTPFPPMTSCIAAMGMVLLLILMSSVVTIVNIAVAIFCSFTIILIEHLFRGIHGGFMEDFELVDGDKEDEEKAVKFLEAFFRAAVKGKKMEGTIECFESEEMAELGYSECSICMDDFLKGEKCLVLPGCGHIFHCKCIARWLKKKLTCPICRSSVSANGNGTGGFRRWWWWWV